MGMKSMKIRTGVTSGEMKKLMTYQEQRICNLLSYNLNNFSRYYYCCISTPVEFQWHLQLRFIHSFIYSFIPIPRLRNNVLKNVVEASWQFIHNSFISPDVTPVLIFMLFIPIYAVISFYIWKYPKCYITFYKTY